MLLAIFILKFFSIIALVVLVLSGYLDFEPMGMQHPLFALPTIFLIYVNDILTIFYFIQTGRGVKDAAEEADLDMPELADIRINHGKGSKGATINLFLITLAAVFGGTTAFTGWGPQVHGYIALICVALYLKGTFDSFKYLWKNSEYMNAVAEKYWEKMPAGSEGSGAESTEK